ncbi:MAG: formyltransferase family protein, partial [Ramlibacter sp.]
MVSASAANLDWATAQGIPAVRMDGEWAAQLDGLRFDYLFSVANLRMLPQAVLDRAGKLAINFHDALLPRYAGLNATCWALMAREPVHGITWHEMTARADAGRIVRQAPFEVSPGETALSLNAKCYEAGLSAFTAIAEDLARGELALQPQHGERQYFGRHKRPALLGTLDFSQPAEDLAALVRALDFGQYANPLGRAKVLAGDQLVLVRTASIVPAQGSAAPGTVLQAEGDTL